MKKTFCDVCEEKLGENMPEVKHTYNYDPGKGERIGVDVTFVTQLIDGIKARPDLCHECKSIILHRMADEIYRGNV